MKFEEFVKEWYDVMNDSGMMTNINDFRIDFKNQQIIINIDPTVDPDDSELYCVLGDYLNNINVGDHNYIIYTTPVKWRYVIKEKDSKTCPPSNINCFVEVKEFIVDIRGIGVELRTYDDQFLYDIKKFKEVLKRYLENNIDAVGIYSDTIILYKNTDRGSLKSFIEIHRDEHDIIKDYPEFSHHYVYESYDEKYKEIKKLVIDYILNLVKGDC